MDVIAVINRRVKERGISNAELARRTGIRPELLRRCLKRKRVLKASELVSICRELRLDLDDFKAIA